MLTSLGFTALALTSFLVASPPDADPIAAAPPAPGTAQPQETNEAPKRKTKRPPLTREQLDQKRFEIYLAGRGFVRLLDTPPQPGGALQIGLGVRLWRGLYLEAELGEGLFARPLGNAGQILFGLTWELRKLERVRPYATLALTHAHESSLVHLAHNPASTLLGTAHTIHHRTGMQLGTGVRLPWSRLGAVGSRFATVVRTDVAYYFDEGPGRLQVGLGVGVQVVF